MSTTITGILLAAGASKRFGTDKLLHRLKTGQTVLETSASNLAAVVPDIIIVYNPENQVLSGYLDSLKYKRIENPTADQGMGNSIACGVKASGHADGWLIALGDMPFIKPQSIKLIGQALCSGNKIVAPFYQGKRGHPVGFNKQFYDALQSLDGDAGARLIVHKHLADLTKVDIDDAGILKDIDSRNDVDC